MVHKRIASSILAVVLAVLMVGCPTAQQWFDIVGGLLPIIGQTYLQFYGYTSGHAPDPGDIARVQALTTAGQDAIKQVEALIAAYKAAPANTGVLGQANAILTQLQASVNNFLNDAQIKNSANFNNYSSFAEAILTDVQDVIGLIPVVTTVVQAQNKGATSTVTMPTSYHKAKSLKSVFQERLNRLPK